MLRMTVYAGVGPDDEDRGYKPSTTIRMLAESNLSDELGKLGLEWPVDYFQTRQTVITLDPMPDESGPDVRARVRAATAPLKGTGLL
jgi:hypothetical protein